MSFVDFQYPFFLILTLLLFFGLPHRYRWILLLAASYYFYACWDFKYLSLVIISTLIDYYAAIKMDACKSKEEKKPFLLLSLVGNLGLLFFFKYYGFAVDTANSIMRSLNILHALPQLNLLLPVGISFYTFQTMSYSIDVYRSRLRAEKHLGYFALFVTFFPQLVAGPIERASHLLPQLREEKVFDTTLAREGLREMLWGFFKKIVIADYLALFVNLIFASPDAHSATMILLAMYFVGIQVYCDFSGYANIAVGSAKLFGIKLMKNFNKPYFAKSIQEFWARWHISLSTWFKDYVFRPLISHRLLAITVVFMVSGLWHGARWTFVVWGIYNLLLYLAGHLGHRILRTMGLHKLAWLVNPISTLLTYNLFNLSWVLFRSQSFAQAYTLYQKIFSQGLAEHFRELSNFAALQNIYLRLHGFSLELAFALVLFLFAVDYFQDKVPVFFGKNPIAKGFRWVSYSILIIMILVFYKYNQTDFVYFQF